MKLQINEIVTEKSKYGNKKKIANLQLEQQNCMQLRRHKQLLASHYSLIHSIKFLCNLSFLEANKTQQNFIIRYNTDFLALLLIGTKFEKLCCIFQPHKLVNQPFKSYVDFLDTYLSTNITNYKYLQQRAKSVVQSALLNEG